MKHIKAQHIGLATGGLMIIASLMAYYLLKLPFDSDFQLLVYLLYSAGIVYSLLSAFIFEADKKTFKDYFSVGFKTFVVVTLLMALFTLIFFSIHTDFRDAKIAENNRALLAEGNHLTQEMEANSNTLKKLFLPIMVSVAVFRYLIVGALVSAIAAGFISSKKASMDKAAGI